MSAVNPPEATWGEPVNQSRMTSDWSGVKLSPEAIEKSRKSLDRISDLLQEITPPGER